MRDLRVILISGVSGSGKTTAIKALEDIGFFCVDNLPIVLLPKFLELCYQSAGKISKVAVVEDIRGYAPYPWDERDTGGAVGKDFQEDSRRIVKGLQKEGYHIEVIFLDSSDAALMRRYSETRRQHPLATGGSIREGIRLERERLQLIREMADRVIDTTSYTVHQLRDEIQRYAQESSVPRRMTITLISFGYSFGIPYEADLLFDVRFLPNPYFVEDLKLFNGNNPKVAEYVLQWEEAKEFLDRAFGFLQFLLPLYEREGKTHLTVAVGCTGGRHRSMVIANRLAAMLRESPTLTNSVIVVRHRDAEKG